MLEHIKFLQSALKKNELAIFVGAGVSKTPPSNLLSWKELVRILLYQLSKLEPEKGFDNHIETLMSLSLPLDFIVDQIAYFHLFGCKKVMSDLLKGAKYNRHHIRLAKNLHNEGIIVTTNYDNCIERVLDNDQIDYHLLISDLDFIKFEKELSKKNCPSMLAKIHGDIDHPESMIGTSSEIRRGLSSVKRLFMKTLLENRHVLFIGYSGNDLYLDDNYLLMREHVSTSKGFTWCFRPGSEKNKTIEELAKLYTSAQKKAVLIESDIDEILTNLWPNETAEHINEGQTEQTLSEQDVPISWPDTGGVPIASLIFAELFLHVGEINQAELIIKELLNEIQDSNQNYVKHSCIIFLMRVAQKRGDHPSVIEVSKKFDTESLKNDKSQYGQSLLGGFRSVEALSLEAIGEYEKAIHSAKQALEIFRQLKDYKMLLKSLGNLSLNLIQIGGIHYAKELLEEAHEMVLKVGDLKSESAIYNNLALTNFFQGNYNEGLAELEKSLKLTEKIGDHKGTCAALYNKGLMLVSLRQLNQSYDAYNESRSLAEIYDYGYEMGKAEQGMGAVEYYRGNYNDAIRHWDNAAEILKKHGHYYDQIEIAANIAEVLRILGHLNEALQKINDILKLIPQKVPVLRSAPLLHTKGMILLDLEKYADAYQYFEDATKIYRKIGNFKSSAKELYHAGVALLLQQSLEGAKEKFLAAIEIQKQEQDDMGLLDSLKFIGKIYSALEDWENLEVSLLEILDIYLKYHRFKEAEQVRTKLQLLKKHRNSFR
ncbi:MAG: tetratricopeptide repeat protein [Candidatus Hermodarchaeota archaeon]